MDASLYDIDHRGRRIPHSQPRRDLPAQLYPTPLPQTNSMFQILPQQSGHVFYVFYLEFLAKYDLLREDTSGMSFSDSPDWIYAYSFYWPERIKEARKAQRNREKWKKRGEEKRLKAGGSVDKAKSGNDSADKSQSVKHGTVQPRLVTLSTDPPQTAKHEANQSHSADPFEDLSHPPDPADPFADLSPSEDPFADHQPVSMELYATLTGESEQCLHEYWTPKEWENEKPLEMGWDEPKLRKDKKSKPRGNTEQSRYSGGWWYGKRTKWGLERW